MTAVRPRVAMVLAAGRGERMRPLSDVVPKPALPLPDGPVVSSALCLAAATGLDRAVVNAHHLARRMVRAIGTCTISGLELCLSEETELMGTSGALALARQRGLLGDSGPVLVINADGVFDLELERLIGDHAISESQVTLGLLPHPAPQRWSRVVLDDGGTVTAIRPAGPLSNHEAGFLYPGVMVVSRQVIDQLEVASHNTPEALWWPALESGQLRGVVVTGQWREVGTPADYLEVVRRQLAERSFVHPSARVSPSARLSRSLIGEEAEIGAEASIDDSVVAEGAKVKSRGVLSSSVLLGQVEVTAGAIVRNRYLARPV